MSAEALVANQHTAVLQSRDTSTTISVLVRFYGKNYYILGTKAGTVTETIMGTKTALLYKGTLRVLKWVL